MTWNNNKDVGQEKAEDIFYLISIIFGVYTSASRGSYGGCQPFATYQSN
jgi:hypothetical protein